MVYLQDLIQKLSNFWVKNGCSLHFGYDLETGAGTFNPSTFFRSLGPEPYSAAYLEPSRRPTDGRYGENPSRMQHFLQYQVIMKPSPDNLQQLYLESLREIGIDIDLHDIRFVHDDWKSPTLGAWGLGWEVWIDGMEVSQFTYFQNFGGQDLRVIPGEITYGVERLAMYIQQVDNVYELQWSPTLTYGEVYHQNEVQWSRYNYELANTTLWSDSFDRYEEEALNLLKHDLPIPSYDFVIKASHAFNLLEARGVISVSERTNYINRVRKLACEVANKYLEQRESLGFPLQLKSKQKDMEPIEIKDLEFDPQVKEDFVLELGLEEMPRPLTIAGMRILEKDLRTLLNKCGIEFVAIFTYGSPRRLTAYIEGLAKGIPAKSVTKKGPSVDIAFDKKGQLTSIGKGFLQSLNKQPLSLSEVEADKDPQLSVRSIDQGAYLFHTEEQPSISTFSILLKELPLLLSRLDFPQKMLWSDCQIPFPRPLHWIVAIHGSDTIPIQFANLTASNKSNGHPLLYKKKVVIKKAKDYLVQLEKAYVIVDPQKRRATILEQLEALEQKHYVKATNLETVLQEILYLTEYPQLTLASFDRKFLEVPHKLLELVLITHQKHFPLIDNHQMPSPHFIACLDTLPNETILAGHEKAVSPRLADGFFLYRQDIEKGLQHFAKQLRHITFHNDLGTLEEKSKRILQHATALNLHCSLVDVDDSFRQSAFLLKADLASSVVFDFPELQGTMGQIYAEAADLPSSIGHAIFEHWLPRFDNDLLPATKLGVIFSIADKIDNLLACFTTNRRPTSSSDPFALRRQALGVIRILIEHQIHLPLTDLLTSCSSSFEINQPNEVVNEIVEFFRSRFKTVLKQYQLKPDEIVATQNSDDVYAIFLKAKALHEFKKNALFTPLIEVFKRLKGQLKESTKTSLNVDLFQTEQEKNLDNLMNQKLSQFNEAQAQHNYTKCLKILASLHQPLEELFEHVKILDNDLLLKENRLALLTKVSNLFGGLLNFSLVKK